ncbi:hypothetical protein LJB96_02895, partial [Methanobrevibacter sp. OttesenSCG-928-K11]|nr:hypothetical protein [Methanobrevibacter sp. OttesenSCG-928-K11]MDL2270947.1 hypothetical protein [Methanobrevibacter sp. OttesenSCG-928-I08]
LLIAFSCINVVSANDIDQSEGIIEVENLNNIIDTNSMPHDYYLDNTNTNNDLKIDTIIDSSDIELYCKNGTRFEIILKDEKGNALSDQEINFFVNGVNYPKNTDSKGYVSLGINLMPGKYTITTSFAGNEKYNGFIINNTIFVKNTISGNDINKYFGSDTKYYATFLDGQGNPLKNGTIYFNINGIFYKKFTNDYGIAELNIRLNPDEYIITAAHPETGVNFTNIVNVISTITSEDLTKHYLDENQYTATFLDSEGNPLKNTEVKFNINGVFYPKITNDEGIAELNINLVPNTYILTAIHPVSQLMRSFIVTVLPNPTNGNENDEKTVSLSDITQASANLKDHIETHGTFPEIISVGNYDITVSQFLYLMASAISNYKTVTTFTIITVNNPVESTGDEIMALLYSADYKNVASDVVQYINTHNEAPVYIGSSIGKIQYNTLVYIFSKILNFVNTNNALPTYTLTVDLLDKHTITVIMKPSGVDSGKYEYKYYKTTWLNYCAACHYHGTLLDNPKNVPEGEFTCWNCDADWCGVSGIDKWPRYIYLTKIGESVLV